MINGHMRAKQLLAFYNKFIKKNSDSQYNEGEEWSWR